MPRKKLNNAFYTGKPDNALFTVLFSALYNKAVAEVGKCDKTNALLQSVDFIVKKIKVAL
jgi:hypothetical protein